MRPTQTKPNLNATQPTNPPTNLNASLTGTYQVLPSPEPNGDWRAFVYRNGRVVTQARAATKSAAVREARGNVRNARKAGGL